MAQNVHVLDSGAEALRPARVHLAAAHRIAHRFGFDDGIRIHFTLMIPGRGDRFLVKVHGLLMNEVRASHPFEARERRPARDEPGYAR